MRWVGQGSPRSVSSKEKLGVGCVCERSCSGTLHRSETWEATFASVGGCWEWGRGVIRSGNALPFFFFFCWSRILLLLLYNRYRNLNLKPFQLRLILSLLVVSDAVDDRRRHYHKSAELTMIFRSPPESGWQSPQLGNPEHYDNILH